jgi:hypothetical protein
VAALPQAEGVDGLLDGISARQARRYPQQKNPAPDLVPDCYLINRSRRRDKRPALVAALNDEGVRDLAADALKQVNPDWAAQSVSKRPPLARKTEKCETWLRRR